MASLLSLPLIILLLLALSPPHVRGSTNAESHVDQCLFSIPDVSSGSCYTYDLSPLAAPAGHWANITGESYLINLCGAIQQVPAACAALPPATGYQYLSQGPQGTPLCLDIGHADPAYYNAQHDGSGQGGLRLAYGNGSSLYIGSTRSFAVTLTCNASAGVGAPVYTGQNDAQYTFTWATAAACPRSHSPTPCPITYASDWLSLNLRPLPGWFDDAKFGIFLHWGMYSVPAFRSEWYVHNLNGGTWGPNVDHPSGDFVEFHNRVYGCSGVQPDKYPCSGPPFSFADFAPMFKAEFFDPDAWAALFQQAGAKYVVLTSKHHEGFCLWPSAQHWNWNSVDTGPHRDLVGELTASVRRAGLVMGVYHSLREWYHPLYLQDNDDGCATTAFVDEVLLPSLQDLSSRYSPDVFWADGAGDAPCTHDSVAYWKAPQFISWLYNNASNRNSVVVNNRWGSGSGGDYETGGDRFTPGKLLPYKWESCYTVQKGSWGYDRTEDIGSYWDSTYLVHQLVETVSCGGNLLLNVGPTADGRIMPAFQQRLLEMGAWLQVNGEAIYKSKAWRAQNDTADGGVWYTTSADAATVYAISFTWPDSGELVLAQPRPAPQQQQSVALLGHPGLLPFRFEGDGLHVLLPTLNPLTVPAAKAFTFALKGMM